MNLQDIIFLMMSIFVLEYLFIKMLMTSSFVCMILNLGRKKSTGTEPNPSHCYCKLLGNTLKNYHVCFVFLSRFVQQVHNWVYRIGHTSEEVQIHLVQSISFSLRYWSASLSSAVPCDSCDTFSAAEGWHTDSTTPPAPLLEDGPVMCAWCIAETLKTDNSSM